MATVDSLKGVPKAFESNSKSKVNAMVDKKMAEAATKPKGMLKEMPSNKKADGSVRVAPRAAQARGTAGATARTPGVTRQTMEAVGNKGGKVDRRA